MAVSGQVHTSGIIPSGKDPWYPQNRKLETAKEKNLYSLPGIHHYSSAVQPIA